ncbi:MAG: (d)CMP kinase [Lachnospiraceae bacterium]|nr:(d)CMP kinase [Lachnospiraceae bacterium]MCI9545618.1 (d)CMP kinase [Lachnospiraceae bacterium]
MTTNIAIDGPAGAGKSTIAKRVARELSFIYVDTGAMYRAMALYLLRQNIEAQDTAKIEEICEQADIAIAYESGEQQVILNGENVTAYLRAEEVGKMASASSPNAKVREKLVALQQKLAREADVVMDGRDIGTKVLPDAAVKIYLTASVRIRAMRRYQELQREGVSSSLEEIEKSIQKRDEQDKNRENSPLRQAEDAVLVDSSEMTIDQVVEEILSIYRKNRESGL